MKLRDEIELQYRLDKVSFINFLKHERLITSIIIFYIVFFVVLISYLSITSESDSESEVVHFSKWSGLPLIYALMGFSSIIGSLFLGVTSRRDITFFFPRPISKRSIFLKKIISIHFVLLLIAFPAIIIFIYIERAENYLRVDYLKLIFSVVTFTLITFGIGNIVNDYYYRLEGKKQKLLKWLIISIISIVTMEVIYVLFSNFGRDIVDIHNAILNLPPLNILYLLPLSSSYICYAKGIDLNFVIALFANGLLTYVILQKTIRFEYEYFEDFGLDATSHILEEQELKKKQYGWHRPYILSGLKYDYPHFGKREVAATEASLLTGLRTTLIFQMMFLFVVLFMQFMLFGFQPLNEQNLSYPFTIEILFVMVFFVIPLLIEFNGFYKLQIFPLRGSKVMMYMLLPRILIIMLMYYSWIGLNILLGTLKDLEIIFIFSWAGGLVILTTNIAQGIGLALSGIADPPSGTFNRSGLLPLILMGLVIPFSISIHTIASQFIQTAWKFLFVGLADIGLIFFYIRLFDYLYKKPHISRVKIYSGYISSGLLLIFLVLALIRSPLVESFQSLQDDEPDTWAMKVESQLLIEDKEITLEDHLYITSSGNLTIINSTIVFDCEKRDSIGISLANGGDLFISNSTIHSQNSKAGLHCELHGKAVIERTHIYNSQNDIIRNVDLSLIAIYSSRVSLDDCVISHSINEGIHCNAISPAISNTTISNCRGNGIEFYHSSAKVTNCTIINNGASGIYIEESKPEITGCTFEDNGGSGIFIESGTPVLENNIYEDNEKGPVRKKA